MSPQSTPSPSPPGSRADDVARATRLLLETAAAMTDDEHRGASLLPEWSRAHVLAHLTLNAEGLAGVLDGARRGESVPMYPSAERRDPDIDDLAREPLSTLRPRLVDACTRFDQALRAALEAGAAQVDGSLWDRRFERTPGGKVLPVAGVPSMREREVEIHHADLGLARTAREWSSTFATDLLQARLAAAPERSLRVHATDLDRSWQSGPGGQAAPGTPVVHGTVADLAWWLTGREGRGLTSDDGVVPGIEEW